MEIEDHEMCNKCYKSADVKFGGGPDHVESKWWCMECLYKHHPEHTEIFDDLNRIVKEMIESDDTSFGKTVN